LAIIDIADSFVLRYAEINIHESALKHDIPRQEIIHAHANSIGIFEFYESSGFPRLLIIGPDNAGNLLELIVSIDTNSSLRIFHAMKLREKFVKLVINKTSDGG